MLSIRSGLDFANRIKNPFQYIVYLVYQTIANVSTQVALYCAL